MDASRDGHLGRRERELLDFERDWPTHAGRKNTAIRERFDVTPARYYQLLNRVLDNPEASAYDPLTVKRLQRRRQDRLRKRNARVLGEPPGP